MQYVNDISIKLEKERKREREKEVGREEKQERTQDPA